MEKRMWFNRQKNWDKGREYLTAAGMTGLLMLILAVLFDYYYCMNDDVTMRDILCGSYTGVPESRNIQMLYPVSAFISLFYRVVPSVPWYGIFLCGCQFLSLFLICSRVAGLVDKLWKKAVMSFMAVFLMGIVLLYELVFVQYTMTCGMLMAAAVFWFYTSDRRKSPFGFFKENTVSIVLTVLAFGIRTEMALLLFPFLLVAGLCKWAGEEKFFTGGNFAKYLGIIGTAGLVMGIMLLADKAACGSAEWERFKRFFDYRTEIYDFLGYPAYGEAKELYDELGIAAEETVLIDNYNFALDEKIDEQVLEKLVSYQKERRGGKSVFLIGTGEAVWIYRHSLLSLEYMPYNGLVIFVYFLLVAAAAENRNKSYFWKFPLLLLTRSVCWMYIIFRNRTPERITHGLFLMELVLLFALLAEEWKEKKTTRLTVSTVACLIVAVSMPAILSGVWNENTQRKEINKEWIALQEYCREHPDNFYLIDVYSSVDYTEKMFLDVDNSYRNFDMCGGWTAKSPLQEKKLLRSGITDLEEDLKEKDNVFFVSKFNRDVGWLKEYYAAKGRKIEIEVADEILWNGEVRFVIYRLL